ncbi:MAG: InlB B-repeat-containing protein [Oscillospiraceae bacterium]|nr:InlB B-repeat-containing protein [Oscillospiraceae bacterium]
MDHKAFTKKISFFLVLAMLAALLPVGAGVTVLADGKAEIEAYTIPDLTVPYDIGVRVQSAPMTQLTAPSQEPEDIKAIRTMVYDDDEITLTANGEKIEMYSVWVNNTRIWNGDNLAGRMSYNNPETNPRVRMPVAIFSADEGDVEIEIKGKSGNRITGTNATVSPLKNEYTVDVTGTGETSTTKFTIPTAVAAGAWGEGAAWGQYVVQWDEDIAKALAIFINPPEEKYIEDIDGISERGDFDAVFEAGVHDLSQAYAARLTTGQANTQPTARPGDPTPTPWPKADDYSEWWASTQTLNMFSDVHKLPSREGNAQTSGSIPKKDSGKPVSVGPNTPAEDSNIEGRKWYIAPGAVIRGGIGLKQNSGIYGFGVIDGSWKNGHMQHGDSSAVLPIQTVSDKNVTVDGITILDSNAWNIQLHMGEGATINNVKIVSSRHRSDGISLQSFRDVEITNCFLRTWDDAIVLKNYRADNNTDHAYAKSTSDVTVRNCVIWSDFAQTLEIGAETNKGNAFPDYGAEIKNVIFEDITIVNQMHKAAIGIKNSDNALVSGITFKNIDIEYVGLKNTTAVTGTNDGWPYIIDINNVIYSSEGWTTVPGNARGAIWDVLIEDVTIHRGHPDWEVQARFANAGTAPAASRTGVGWIHDVYLKNIIYKGYDKQGVTGGDVTGLIASRASFGAEVTVLSSSEPKPGGIEPRKLLDSWTVSFNINGGTSGTMTDQTFVDGAAQGLRRNTFSRTGHTFEGWAESATGAVKYTDQHAVTFSDSAPFFNKDVTLYAVWKQTSVSSPPPSSSPPPQSYTVRFSRNGGSGSMADQKITRGVSTALNAKPTSLKRTGYKFDGWALTSKGNRKYKDKERVSNLAAPNATITLHAVWKANAPSAPGSLKLKSSKKRQVAVTFKRVSNVSGYQVRHSPAKNMKKGAKITTIKRAATTKATIKKLASRKNTWVQVRSYRDSSNGTRVFSKKWSKAKKVRVR